MVEEGSHVCHWLIEEGVTAGGELAACGRDVHLAIDRAAGQRVRAKTITCPRCLKLLALASCRPQHVVEVIVR